MSPPVPNEFFVFVNEASVQAQHNLAITGTFTSRCYGRLVVDGLGGVLSQAQLQEIADVSLSGDLAKPVDLPPFVPNPAMNPPTYSPFTLSAMADYRVEWDAEQCRLRHFPSYPSRLSALFAFGSEEQCRLAADMHGWSLQEVRRFRNGDSENFRAVCVNMEVVSLMRDGYRAATWSATELDAIWRHYWGGQGDLEIEVPTAEVGPEFSKRQSGVIWEWLIEGKLVCEDPSPVF